MDVRVELVALESLSQVGHQNCSRVVCVSLGSTSSRCESGALDKNSPSKDLANSESLMLLDVARPGCNDDELRISLD